MKMMRILPTLFFILGAPSLWGQSSQTPQYFTIGHQTCEAQVFLETEGFNDSDKKTMLSKMSETASKKGYRIDEASQGSNRIASNQLYFDVEMKRSGFLYKNCQVIVELKEPQSQRPTTRDKVLHKGEVERRFPRVTFKGNERCTRAIDDAFVHIPTCARRQ